MAEIFKHDQNPLLLSNKETENKDETFFKKTFSKVH